MNYPNEVDFSPDSNPDSLRPVEMGRTYNLITTIYRLKVQLSVLLILLVGVFGSFYAEHLIATHPDRLGKFAFLPFKTLGDACLIALIVGITFEWIVRKESERKLGVVLRTSLAEQSRLFAAIVTRSLILNKDVVKTLLKPDELETLIKTGLQIKLDDDELGSDLYDGLLKQSFGYQETWHNYQYKASLASITDLNVSEEIREQYFQAYIDLRYETLLNKTSFLFTCATTVEEYDLLLRDPKCQEAWHIPLTKEIPRLDETTLNVKSINVGGVNLNIRREPSHPKGCTIVCDHPNLKDKLGTWVTVHYRYETKVRKRGHLFKINLVFPTKNINMELDFAKTDIHYMNVLDFFVSVEPPNIRYVPLRNRPHRIEVELGEWGFPKGGVVFVWVLEKEMSVGAGGRRRSPKRT